MLGSGFCSKGTSVPEDVSLLHSVSQRIHLFSPWLIVKLTCLHDQSTDNPLGSSSVPRNIVGFLALLGLARIMSLTECG